MFESVSTSTKVSWRFWTVLALVAILLGTMVIGMFRSMHMPLKSFKGPLTILSKEQADLAQRLALTVRYLSETIGERNVPRVGSLQRTAKYLGKRLEDEGYKVREVSYVLDGQTVSNLEAMVPGSVEDAIVVGAHYDSVPGTVGANDNCTGVAAVLELVRRMKADQPRKTIRFALFVNEEPPYFQTDEMGSLVYAKRLKSEGVKVSAMVSLETIGHFSDVPGSQEYPVAIGMFYPSEGNFIGFVGNRGSQELVHRTIRAFRETTSFPSEGIAAPEDWTGVGWSDHWSFWQEGYPAIMVTDTAPFRYKHYHTPQDTADKIDFEKMARVVEGLHKVVEKIANEP